MEEDFKKSPSLSAKYLHLFLNQDLRYLSRLNS